MPVGHSPGLCSCGNRARLTCQLCSVGMCADCDVLSRPAADLQAWPVQVVGFGYINRAWDYRYRFLNLAQHDGGAYGPFLYLSELMSSLASAHGLAHRNGAGPVRHLCWPCVYTAVPDTAERIANGLMCETPRCVSEPCQRCRCCGGAFCELCLTHVRLYRTGPCRITWTEPGSEISGDEEARVIGARIERSVLPAMPRGLCGICVNERQYRQKEMSEEIVSQQYSGILVPAPDAAGGGGATPTAIYLLPAVKRWTGRGREQEQARARDALERCVAGISEQLGQLPLAPCHRAPAFSQGLGYAYYMLLDARNQRAPAAAAVS